MKNQPLQPMALTMGEPAGIGTEITLMAWANKHDNNVPFFLIDDIDNVTGIRNQINIDTPLIRIETPDDAAQVFANALPVLHQRRSGKTTQGIPSVDTAPSVISSIETAVRLAQSGKVGAIITNPIQKSVLYQAGFNFPGHTEFLGALGGTKSDPVMMLACDKLRVVPVSVHISLRQAIDVLTSDLIFKQARVTWNSLRSDFGIKCPRLAIAGLNPHAGEASSMGTEDEEIIKPAINALRDEGIDANGPFPPDTLFTDRARPTYDAAICMYHDQALIPIKTLDFDQGVNVTLGLPFIRTSPDHGTALDIAGKGIANPQSLLSALDMASQMARCRAAARY